MSSRFLGQALVLVSPFLVRTTQCLVSSHPVRHRHRAARCRLRAAPLPADAAPAAGAPSVDRAALARLASCRTRTAAHQVLARALSPAEADGGVARLYGSAQVPEGLSRRRISDAELALQTRTINSKYKILELIEQNGDRDIDRATLAVLCVFLFGSASAILAQQAEGLPEIVRWSLVFSLCFSPLGLVGLGLAVPEELSAALAAIQRQVFPSFRKRTIQHEAGHFLAGYLLGWPVKAYQANKGMKNSVEFYPLGDADAGSARAEALGFDVRNNGDDEERYVPALLRQPSNEPYFSKDGRGAADAERSVLRDREAADAAYFALAPQDEPTSVWPYRGFDPETVDNLAVISVAGVSAELLAYGNAEGGFADLQQLRRIYGAAASDNSAAENEGSGSFGSFSDDATERRLRRENGTGKGKMDEKEMDNRTKFALGYAIGLLRQHLGALDALAEVMARDGSVAECILVLETCPNVSGATVKGDYDKLRREVFRAEDRVIGAWVEQTFLGGKKNIDVEDNRSVEGKGGGDRKESFGLTGDDPIYAAVACAVIFFAWASSGGLTLH